MTRFFQCHIAYGCYGCLICPRPSKSSPVVLGGLNSGLASTCFVDNVGLGRMYPKHEDIRHINSDWSPFPTLKLIRQIIITMYNTIVCEKNTTSPLGTSRPQMVHILGELGRPSTVV